MSRRGFRLCGAAIMVIVVALIGWSITAANAVVPAPAAIGGALLLYLCRRQVKGVVADERNYRISDKASRFAVQAFAFVTAVAGTTLIAMGKDDSSSIGDVGLTLAFSACGLLILYVASYAYCSRRS